MPDEKQVWKVEESARSPLEQLQECAQVPAWFVHILQTGTSPFSPEFRAAQMEERKQWDTVEKAEAVLRERTEQLCNAIRAASDEQLNQSVELMPGWSVSLAEICWFHQRNLWYHAGQVNFIQTLYGDMDMH